MGLESGLGIFQRPDFGVRPSQATRDRKHLLRCHMSAWHVKWGHPGHGGLCGGPSALDGTILWYLCGGPASAPGPRIPSRPVQGASWLRPGEPESSANENQVRCDRRQAAGGPGGLSCHIIVTLESTLAGRNPGSSQWHASAACEFRYLFSTCAQDRPTRPSGNGGEEITQN